MDILTELFATVAARRDDPQEGSYTAYLFREGTDKILKKCGEEAAEMIIAAKNKDKSELIAETSDLLYHVLVLLKNEGVELADVYAELTRRHQKTGNLKQMKTVDKNT